MSKTKNVVISLLIVAAAGGAYFAWQAKETAKPETASAGGKPAGAAAGANAPAKTMSVSVMQAKKRDYPVKLSANGVVSALNMVDIRAQVTSTVAKVHIKEGQFVRAGEVLFTLDSRNDEVNLAKAKAQLDKDMATLADFERQYARNKDLVEKKFLAQSAVDSSLTQVQAQQAVIASDKAAIEAARVALSYNRIVAPAAGRTGIINVFAGSLVQANATALPLVTITQMDPIAITFALPQRNLADALAAQSRSDSYVTASLPDNSASFKGKIQFIDNQVDAASGTVKLKAIFDNKDLKLWPGAYANVELSIQNLKDVIVFPQDAVVIGARGNSVFVVDADGKAAQKPVTVPFNFGSEAVVNGVEEGAMVIIEGKQNLRSGTPVKVRDNEGAADKKAKPSADAKAKTAPVDASNSTSTSAGSPAGVK
ncbi:MAG: efflux RND transporter periplasmic adaptor subunit [Burkholderiaceae bacterium]|nr:efflux RND transporter periplasmic adaptor subunit [Burkholderiaceae bacterium]